MINKSNTVKQNQIKDNQIKDNKLNENKLIQNKTIKKISPKNRDSYLDLLDTINNLKKNGLINSYLGNKGYSIYKVCLTPKIIEFIKKELTVKPFIQNSLIEAKPFPIYQESEKKIYVPRYWGINIFGYPKLIKISFGDSINLKFNGVLRDYQTQVLNEYLNTIDFGISDNENKGNGAALIELWTGAGKCHGIDTPIMMYNGDVKMVQDIKVGDQLMGDDSTPRNVLSLARGKEMLYDIIPTKGDKYTINESHILSLKMSSNYNNKKYNHLKKNDIYDISLVNYLNLPKGLKHVLKGYHVGVEFPHKDVTIEPYFLGLWLGDGTSRTTGITTNDQCVIDYINEYAKRLNSNVTLCDSKGTRCCTYSIVSNSINKRNNSLLCLLKNHDLLLNKHIPKIYKCNSRKIRLELLAGIIDSDGHNSHGGYDIIQKNESLLDDIVYLARSLGFAAYKKVCKKSCIYNGVKKEGIYYRTNIHGKGLENIPVKCERKKVEPRRQIKDALNTGIKVVKKEIDNYYGFELDGNHRYLLGDCTVTHNTVLGLKIIEVLKKKTIIFVHKTFLKDQWIERIQQYLPNAKIGTIQGQIVDIDNKDIVIAMIQSVSMKSYPDSLFDSFGLSVYDEAHHLSSEVFSNCLKKCNTLYGLGLSATMERKDGLTNVFKMYLGEICYKPPKNSSQDNVLVKAIDFIVHDEEYNEVERDFRGNVKYTTMVSKVSNLNMRSDFIVHILESELFINPNQQFIVLAQTKNILNYLYKAINYKNIASVGYYIGGMKNEDLKKSESKTIILATFSMAAEALDIKSLTSLFLASPKSDIVQAVGRILREKHTNPLVIDLIDNHDVFLNQFNKRRAFYNEKNYKIIRTNNEKYNEYIKYLKSFDKQDKSILEIEHDLLNNINSDEKDNNKNTSHIKFWNHLIVKQRKNKKNVILNENNESKCMIDLA